MPYVLTHNNQLLLSKCLRTGLLHLSAGGRVALLRIHAVYRLTCDRCYCSVWMVDIGYVGVNVHVRLRLMPLLWNVHSSFRWISVRLGAGTAETACHLPHLSLLLSSILDHPHIVEGNGAGEASDG